MSWTWTTTAMSKPEVRPAAVPPRLVDEILEEQRRRWREGKRVLVESYLELQPALGSHHVIVLDLIYNEIVLREQAGEQPKQEEYAQRFPHLSAESARAVAMSASPYQACWR